MQVCKNRYDPARQIFCCRDHKKILAYNVSWHWCRFWLALHRSELIQFFSRQLYMYNLQNVMADVSPKNT